MAARRRMADAPSTGFRLSTADGAATEDMGYLCAAMLGVRLRRDAACPVHSSPISEKFEVFCGLSCTKRALPANRVATNVSNAHLMVRVRTSVGNQQVKECERRLN